jgi:hypothetical protein
VGIKIEMKYWRRGVQYERILKRIGHLLKCTSGNKIKQEKCKNELMKNEDGD